MNSTYFEDLPCSLVNSVAENTLEQCKFIMDNDCLEEDSVIDYAYLVYCDFGLEYRHWSILLIMFLVVLLFLALSALADDFLCPSLLTVAKTLRMSDSLAGVTLLAFGNGCPDIFSSLAAASDDSPKLVVGELLGAGIFCTSIVSGLIFIKCDFKLARRPILRDTIVYLFTLYLIWFYCSNEKITFYGALAFIVIYVIYLLVALVSEAIQSRAQGDYSIADKQAENSKLLDGNWYKRQESMRKRRLAEMKRKLEQSDSPLDAKQAPSTDPMTTTIHIGSEGPSSLAIASSIPLESRLVDSIRHTPTLDGGYLNKAFEDSMDMPAMDKTEAQQHPVVKLNQSLSPGQELDLALNEWDHFLSCINPIQANEWNQSSFGCKMGKILRAPFVFVALISVPVVDLDKRLNNWCRPLNSLHCVTSPLCIVTALTFGSLESWSPLGLPISIWLMIPCILLAAFVQSTTIANQTPRYHTVYAYVGFIMSILWIYLLVREIISLLKTVGIIFSLSDTAIGLGVLAWGNSLGDIVANTSLAQAGYPRMAIGATIGSPLLNLLLGFGLSFSLSLKPGQYSVIEYSQTITLLCSTLAIILIALMLSALMPQDKSKKPFGYMLICGYGVYFLLAVYLEYNV